MTKDPDLCYRFDVALARLQGRARDLRSDRQKPIVQRTADDVIFDSDNGQTGYIVIDTGGWLRSRRFLVPPDQLQPSSTHENDCAVTMTKAQIERFPTLDEKVLEGKQKFEDYDKSYRTYWRTPEVANRKPASSTRLSRFQNEIVRNRGRICEPTGRKVS